MSHTNLKLNHNTSNVWNATKAVPWGKFVAINVKKKNDLKSITIHL